MPCLPWRAEFQAQARKAFTHQTYDNAHIVCTGVDPKLTIGATRNKINEQARSLGAEIIVQWDDDDWSHTHRIAEQVALLQATGADCVGYNEMLFWRDVSATDKFNGEAWLYSNPNPRYALGTSLCYWSRAWEARPFPDLQHGEDTEWIRGLWCYGSAAVPEYVSEYVDGGYEPRMIARIHSGNSSSAYDPIEMARHNVLPWSERQWSRVPQWDQVCREAMER